MKYFIPEWDDRVDPKYDFLRDKHSPEHMKDAFSDHYMWELFGIEKVPFNGVLISRFKTEESKPKLQRIKEMGIHEFLRLPETFPILGDCGAWGYIDEKLPLYDAVETLEFYKDIGVNIGVSVDHLVVKRHEADKDLRMQITFENGIKSFHVWQQQYVKDFNLLCAVQGGTVDEYIEIFEKYASHGIRAFAFGGLARRPTTFILKLIQALNAKLESRSDIDTIHFFGLARPPLFKQFAELEKKSVEVTFDSASFLRRAWLSAQNNYFTSSGKAYSAIRIPQIGRRSGLRGKNKPTLKIDEEQLKKLESKCLSQMRLYGKSKTDVNSVMKSLENYENASGRARFDELKDYYMETLADRPWAKCDCPICSRIGVEVIIFRGNNRNRRRGFHNVWVFYQMLSNPQHWTKVTPTRKTDMSEVDLASLKKGERVLVITSCTKEKMGFDKNTRAPAKSMYKGRLFKAVKGFSTSKKLDYVIISAKYGLIFPDEVIEGYEKMLRTKRDIEEIRPKVEARLQKILGNYDKIILLMGSKYVRVLDNLVDYRFFHVKSRGYGDLCSKIRKAADIAATSKIHDFYD